VCNDEHLERLLKCFTAYPSAALVFSDALFCNGRDGAGANQITAKVARRMIDQRVSIRDIRDCWIASMSVVMVSKRVFDAAFTVCWRCCALAGT